MGSLSVPDTLLIATASNDAKYLNVLRVSLPWLDGATLASCCRVSKSSYTALNSHLWSDPIKILSGKESPFTKSHSFLTKFSTFRKETRKLVSTLDLRVLLEKARIKKNDWDQNEWKLTGQRMFTVLNEYVNLRFAILDGLEGFQGSFWSTDVDESSLRAFNQLALSAAAEESTETAVRSGDDKTNHIFLLPEPVMLSVTGCRDLDCLNALTCPSMAHLLYLDISYTSRAESWLAFSALNFTSLRVLKVRGLGLTDNHLSQILGAVPGGLWSLDARENLLTDTTIWTILDRSLPKISVPIYNKNSLLYETAPPYQRDQSGLQNGIVSFRPDSRDGVIRHISQYGHTDIPHRQVLDGKDPFMQSTGITHLYLSGNKFTSSGIRTLLSRTNRLQALDVGSVVSPAPNTPNSLLQLGQPETARLLEAITGNRLEKLRMHHSIATGIPTLAVLGATAFSSSHIKQAEETVYGKYDYTLKFDPKTNFRLKDLTLTGVPTQSSGLVISKLIQLLRNCKKQSDTLHEHYSGKWSSYRRAPPLLSGLQTLRLEFLPSDTSANWTSSEIFLAQSEGDFSFFSDPPPVPQKEVPSEQKLLDVVEELLRVRRENETDKWHGKLELIFPYGR